MFEEGILKWRYALVGQFIGSPPNFGTLQKVIELMWGKIAPVKVSLAGSNLFVFSFVNASARDWVLENGPWHVQHRPIFLRKWEPNMRELHFDLLQMPIWIQLYNITLELFSRKGLSYIASAIGKPLHTDSITASRERLEFAQVCVEISADSKVPESADVLLCDGSIVYSGKDYKDNDRLNAGKDAALGVNHVDTQSTENGSNPPIKRGRGRPTKGGSKCVMGGSKNNLKS
ncbi:uncharacterized protein LOC120159770 [Hibiscus syriacus]|uniref:uncharacterized protein LOC120159770 n=1 Tax=Hibiscus syriacus TaxID=106335 RepID=UPI00192404F6|nr:uncharacterized protein LOC120159770 [Hibiscus syriacus]